VGQLAAEATAALVPLKSKVKRSKNHKAKGRKNKGDDGNGGALARVS
jgi:hypothetical protein